MKLRNKKTGKIKDFGNLQVYAETENIDESQLLGNFNSLEQILEYYEDYKPTEPLIKDKEIRNMVRLWAKIHNADTLLYLKLTGIVGHYLKAGLYTVDIDIEKLKVGTYYTLKELCGDESCE